MSQPDLQNTLHAELQAGLMRVLRSLVFRGDSRLPFQDLPISQFKCLHVIAEAEGLKMLEVSSRMEVGLPAASQIVDRLVKKGLLNRQQDQQDRRVVRLSLSDHARESIDIYRALRQSRLSEVLEHLSEDELRCATDGLIILASAAEIVEENEKDLCGG